MARLFPIAMPDEIVKVQAVKVNGVVRGYTVYLNGVKFPRLRGAWYYGDDYKCVDKAFVDRANENILPYGKG